MPCILDKKLSNLGCEGYILVIISKEGRCFASPFLQEYQFSMPTLQGTLMKKKNPIYMYMCLYLYPIYICVSVSVSYSLEPVIGLYLMDNQVLRPVSPQRSGTE